MPTSSARPAESPLTCLEVVVAWGDAVLHVAHSTPPRSFFVGPRHADHDDGGVPDFVLPAAIAGTRRVPILSVERDGSIWFVPLPGALGDGHRTALTPGSRASMRLGSLTIHA